MHQCSQVPGCDPIILAASKNENKSNQYDANNMPRIIHEYQGSLNSDSYVLEIRCFGGSKSTKFFRTDGNTFIENHTASYVPFSVLKEVVLFLFCFCWFLGDLLLLPLVLHPISRGYSIWVCLLEWNLKKVKRKSILLYAPG